jgi:hypothetical protein
MLHLALGNKESYPNWLEFLRDMIKRGLRCQFSPGTGPLIFGQDGPLAEVAQRQLLRIKQMTDTAC